MLARRLIVAPAVALLALLLVGAVIDAGKRSRVGLTTHSMVQLPTDDTTLIAEAQRIRRAAGTAARCNSTATCTPQATAARIRQAASDIRSWGSDQRFARVRATLRDQLLADAALREHRATVDLDHVTSPSEWTRTRNLEDQLRRAELHAVRAQHAAGLIDRATLDARVRELT